MEFLRDYVSVFPVIIALLNGLLAVLATHYPFKTKARKAWFIGIVLVLNGIAVATSIYSTYQANAEKAAERSRVAGIRDGLALYVAEGNQLLRRLQDPNDATALLDADRWVHETERFLVVNLGSSYVTRFHNPSGLMPFEPSVTTLPEQRKGYWRGVNMRISRLEQFSQELSR